MHKKFYKKFFKFLFIKSQCSGDSVKNESAKAKQTRGPKAPKAPPSLV